MRSHRYRANGRTFLTVSDPPKWTKTGEPTLWRVWLRRSGSGSESARRGLTLLEVLLSLGLFLGALAALSQLWYGGVRASVQARLGTQAILRCESKLNEVVAGAVPLQSTSATPFEDDSTWSWKLQVTPGPHLNVFLVVVTVSHPGQGGLSASGHQLSRLIRDPQVFIDAQQTTTDGTTTP
ncbi:MAG: hypothetical protein ACKV2Q_27590 [Planctomycetaceae bacterium]